MLSFSAGHQRSVLVVSSPLLPPGVVERVRTHMARGPVGRRVFMIAEGTARLHTARIASSMAFNLFLAAIPMLAMAGWFLPLVLRHSHGTLSTASALLQMTPTEVRDIFDRQFGRFSPGTVAPVAVLGSFWMASGAFHTLMSVFETSFDAEHRSWWKKRLIGLGCVLVSILGIGLSGSVVVAVSAGPTRVLERLLGVPVGSIQYGSVIAVPVAVLTLVAMVAGMFRVALRRRGVTRRVWPGAVLCVAIGSIASWGLGIYGTYLARFTVFYGSLATVAVALAWLWLWCAALLLGAQLNVELEDERRAL
jgi:membrane protein